MKPKMKFSDMWNYSMSQISLKEKIILLSQTTLSAAILIILILSFTGILANGPAVTISLILLSALFIVSAIRNFSQKKFSAILYILCAVAVMVYFITTLLR